jgi:hypothetical protein
MNPSTNTGSILLITYYVENIRERFGDMFQLAALYDRLARFRSIHRMVRGAAHVSTFTRNAGWTRAVAEKHAEFLTWGAGIVRACEAMDSRSHDRKKLNVLLSEAGTLANEWACTLAVISDNDTGAVAVPRRRLETMVL